MALKTVYVELVAETKRLNDGIRRADSQIKGFTTGIRRAGLALAGIFSARAMFRSFKGTILDKERLIDTANALGIATGEYEKLAYVIETDLNAAVGTTDRAIRTLQSHLGQASKENKKLFAEFGLDQKEIGRLSPSEQMMTVLRALSQIDDQAKKTSLTRRLFGRGASAEIMKVLNAGTEAIDKANETFKQFGTTFASKEEEQRFKRMGDQFDKVETIWDRLKSKVTLGLLTDQNIRKVEEFSDKIAGVVKNVDMEKASWVALSGAVAAAAAAMISALGPFGIMVGAIAAATVTIVKNWEDLKRSVQWVNEKFGSFSKSIPQRAMDFVTGNQAPAPVMIPMDAKSRSVPAPSTITQNITIQGISFEQALSASRRIGESKLREGAK
jgi:hypothetical protein